MAKTKEETKCEHSNFESNVRVIRLEDGKFMAEVYIRCCDCDMPFIFKGLPLGLNYQGATMSVNNEEARLSIRPRN